MNIVAQRKITFTTALLHALHRFRLATDTLQLEEITTHEQDSKFARQEATAFWGSDIYAQPEGTVTRKVQIAHRAQVPAQGVIIARKDPESQQHAQRVLSTILPAEGQLARFAQQVIIAQNDPSFQ